LDKLIFNPAASFPLQEFLFLVGWAAADKPKLCSTRSIRTKGAAMGCNNF
jgi:hypothetical protein